VTIPSGNSSFPITRNWIEAPFAQSFGRPASVWKSSSVFCEVRHGENEERLEWPRDSFDPEAFDLRLGEPTVRSAVMTGGKGIRRRLIPHSKW